MATKLNCLKYPSRTRINQKTWDEWTFPGHVHNIWNRLHDYNTFSTASINDLLQSWMGSCLKPSSTLICQQELREYPIQFTPHHRPPPLPNLLCEELRKITKLMSQTLNSTIDTPILSKWGSFEVPDPRKSCKKASPPRPLPCSFYGA